MPVTVYTRSTCAPCRMLKTYLQKKGINYKEKNIDENPEFAQEAFDCSGMTMVPVMKVGDKVVAGFNLPLISQALNGIIQGS